MCNIAPNHQCYNIFFSYHQLRKYLDHHYIKFMHQVCVDIEWLPSSETSCGEDFITISDYPDYNAFI
jgi:hypothetical protein